MAGRQSQPASQPGSLGAPAGRASLAPGIRLQAGRGSERGGRHFVIAASREMEGMDMRRLLIAKRRPRRLFMSYDVARPRAGVELMSIDWARGGGKVLARGLE